MLNKGPVETDRTIQISYSTSIESNVIYLVCCTCTYWKQPCTSFFYKKFCKLLVWNQISNGRTEDSKFQERKITSSVTESPMKRAEKRICVVKEGSHDSNMLSFQTYNTNVVSALACMLAIYMQFITFPHPLFLMNTVVTCMEENLET